MKIQVQLTYEENLKYFGAKKNDIVEVEFEEYVAAVTASEIGNTYIEACKAQAIAARSFAISRGVLSGKPISDSSATAQSYRAVRYNNNVFPNCIMAAENTKGIVLMYDEKVINSIYTASNGGRTVSSKEKWGNELPYLIAQDDKWDQSEKRGTGVGMSQKGAIAAAKQGFPCMAILDFYYPNTYIGQDYGETRAKKVAALAKSLLGHPYVFGAIGEECTPEARKRRKRADYPSIVDKCQVLKEGKSSCAGCKYEGTRIFDCRGFTYYCLKQNGIRISTVGATTQWNETKWARKGKIANGIPNCVCCVFKYKDGRMSHTGLHIGDGLIIHCSGEVKYGSIDNTTWTHWGIPPELYPEIFLEHVSEVKAMKTLQRGSSGEMVFKLQTMLNALGYDCGTADGKFGAKTENAVRIFQARYNLTVDGKVGKATMPIIEEKYAELGGEINIPPQKDEDSLRDILAAIKKQLDQIQTQVDECQAALDNI